MPSGLWDPRRLPGQGSHHHVHLLTSDQSRHDDRPCPPTPQAQEPRSPRPTSSAHHCPSSLPQGLCPCCVLCLRCLLVQPASTHPLGKPSSPAGRALLSRPPCEHIWVCWFSVCQVCGVTHTCLPHSQHRAWPTGEGHSGGYSVIHPFAPPAATRPPCTQPQRSTLRSLYQSPLLRVWGTHQPASHSPHPHGVPTVRGWGTPASGLPIPATEAASSLGQALTHLPRQASLRDLPDPT